MFHHNLKEGGLYTFDAVSILALRSCSSSSFHRDVMIQWQVALQYSSQHMNEHTLWSSRRILVVVAPIFHINAGYYITHAALPSPLCARVRFLSRKKVEQEQEEEEGRRSCTRSSRSECAANDHASSIFPPSSVARALIYPLSFSSRRCVVTP